MKRQYYYPQNMKLNPKLWLWSMKDIIIFGIAVIASIIIAVKIGTYIPLVLTALYAFLTMRPDEQSIFDYIGRAVRFFISGQQNFIWKDDR